MVSGTTASLTNFKENDEGVGFFVAPTTGQIYDSSKEDRLYIANFDVFGAPYNSFASQTWDNKSTVSSECALWMCIQTYHVTQFSFNQVQTVVHNFSTINATLGGSFSGADNFTYPPLPVEMNPTSSPTNYTVNILAW